MENDSGAAIAVRVPNALTALACMLSTVCVFFQQSETRSETALDACVEIMIGSALVDYEWGEPMHAHASISLTGSAGLEERCLLSMPIPTALKLSSMV